MSIPFMRNIVKTLSLFIQGKDSAPDRVERDCCAQWTHRLWENYSGSPRKRKV